MPLYNITFKRTHTADDGKITEKEGGIFLDGATEDDAIREGFKLSSCSQVKMFGNTPWHGSYKVTFVSIEEVKPATVPNADAENTQQTA